MKHDFSNKAASFLAVSGAFFLKPRFFTRFRNGYCELFLIFLLTNRRIFAIFRINKNILCVLFLKQTRERRDFVKATTRAIAREAGVSPASVSRYFTGTEPVSQEIASRIEEALRTLGCDSVPRRGQKKIILVLLTHLRFSFYSKTLQELLERKQDSYTFLLLRYTPSSPETVRSLVGRVRPAGVIYFEEEIDDAILSYLQGCGLRTVMCGGAALNRESDMVRVNDITAAYEGTNYLLDLGHRRILFLSDEIRKVGAGFQRLTGCRKAMEERGLPLHPEDAAVICGPVTFQAGYDAVRTALAEKRHFTAVFAFSDELAVGAMAALHDGGLSVPGDVSVLGYDDLDIAAKVRPALTTIHQPIDCFIKKTLELFEQPAQEPPSEILLHYSIVERQSCRRAGPPIVSSPQPGVT